MAFTFTLQSHTFLSQNPNLLSPKPTFFKPRNLFPSLPKTPLFLSLHGTKHSLFAIGPDGKFYPNTADNDPPEAPEDTAHGVSKWEQVHIQASRARKAQEEDFKKNQSTFLKAIADTEVNPNSLNSDGDDLFGEIDKAIVMERQELVKQGLLKPKDIKGSSDVMEGVEELEPEEVVDLEEIDELTGLTVIDTDSDEDGSRGFDVGVGEKSGKSNAGASLDEKSFDLDFDSIGKVKVNIVEPKFRMSLAELLDESKVVPVSVLGDLEVEITGIQDDSRVVSAGDLFVCRVGMKTDGHLYLSEADKRGAVAVVASKEVDIEETLGDRKSVV